MTATISAERLELKRLSRIEREAAREHARRIPALAACAASAFVRAHPLLTAGGAAALGVALASSGGSRTKGPDSENTADRSSWMVALGALAVRALPEILSVAGAHGPSGAARESRPRNAPSEPDSPA